MGFLFNNISSKQMGIRARLTSWQASGTLRNYTTVVPGKSGIADFGADLDAREIKVECGILPKGTFGELIHTLDEIALWLDPTVGLGELVLDDIPDRYFMARIKDRVDCERLLRSAGHFTLNFLCPDPYGYAVNDEMFLLVEKGMHEIFREKGNATSNPIYRLKGTTTQNANSDITITTNNNELKIVNVTLAANETLVIDTEKLTAYVENENGSIVRNGLPYLQKLNFPSLSVGKNTVSIATRNASFESLSIQAKSRWR